MKVTQEKTFTPITIVLETQEEAEYLMSVLGKISGVGVQRDFIYDLFSKLGELGVESDPYNKHFTGILTTRKY